MTLLSAAFLAGVLLVGIPIWLHRLRAHSAEQRPFSSLFLMRRSEAPVQMHKQLQHIALLILRILFVVLLCLAFAEIELDVGANETLSAAGRDRIIVVDTSLSMGAAADSETVLERAKERARELVSGLPTGKRAAVVTANDAVEVQAALTNDRAQLDAAIAAIEQGSGRLSFGGLLGRLVGISGALAGPDDALELHLISDFQAATMPDQFNALVENATLPAELHRVGAAGDNWSIADARLVERDATIDVRVQSHAAESKLARVVVARLEETVASAELSIPPGGARSVQLPVSLEGRDARQWRVELDVSDALAADNLRYVAHVAVEQQALPLIGAAGIGMSYARAAAQAALPRFELIDASDATQLAGPAAVLIDADVEPGSRFDSELAEYVRNGGALLVVAGPNTRARGSIPVIGVALDSARMTRTDFGVVIADRSHPVLSGVGLWRDVRIYQAVKPQANDAGVAVLELDDGSPLLQEHRVGAGRVLVLMTALDPDWSSLAVQPAFAGLFANIINYLAEDLLPSQAIVGQPFAIPAQAVQLFDADGDRVLGLNDTIDRPAVSLDQPGFYEVRTASRAQTLAVNLDPRESDLASSADELLEDWQAQVARAAADSVSAGRANEDEQPRLPVAPWLLMVLGLLILAECFIANWLPNREVTA